MRVNERLGHGGGMRECVGVRITTYRDLNFVHVWILGIAFDNLSRYDKHTCNASCELYLHQET